MKPIRASYDSRCGLCGDHIAEGDEIVNVDGEWCHAQCAEDEGEEIER